MMLELDRVSVARGELRVVRELSLALPPGEMAALLGPNGAGKTSTIMAVAGHVPVVEGTIRFEGRDIDGLPAPERTRLGLGLVPEGRRIFADLTVHENLVVGGYLLPRAEAEAREREVLALFPRLEERHGQRAGTLSGGEQQMLAIARALMVRPRLLLVDELSLGLMPAVVDLCFEVLMRLCREEGLACLVVEQNTQKVLSVADRVTVLSAGRTVWQGDADEARADEALIDRMLGLEAG